MLPGVWGSYATGDEPERKYRFWPGVADWRRRKYRAKVDLIWPPCCAFQLRSVSCLVSCVGLSSHMNHSRLDCWRTALRTCLESHPTQEEPRCAFLFITGSCFQLICLFYPSDLYLSCSLCFIPFVLHGLSQLMRRPHGQHQA